MLIAAVGVAGTLAAALVTQAFAQRADAARRLADDRARWLGDRLRVNARFLAGSLRLERDLWSAASQLDSDSREERMPGATTILLTPEEGIEGVFDETTRDILVEAVEDAFERLNELEEIAAEVALIGTPDEVAAASQLHESLWEVVGLLEGFAPFDDATDAVERCRAARDRFTDAARAGLRSGQRVTAVDQRPRREPKEPPTLPT